MGQKVNPIGLRVGINRDWQSRWYANDKDYAKLLHSDIKIRDFLRKFYSRASVSAIEIARDKKRVRITIHTAKPGLVIGREGSIKDEAIKSVKKMVDKDVNVYLNIVEIKKPDLDAKLVARSIADQLENRVSFRRAQKMAMQRVMKSGAKGVKTLVSGRLGGAEMARSEGYSEGKVPLHTIRADIDYALEEAHTTYGRLGIKVWIYKGEILPLRKRQPKTFDAPKRRRNNDNKNKRNNQNRNNDRRNFDNRNKDNKRNFDNRNNNANKGNNSGYKNTSKYSKSPNSKEKGGE